MSNTYIPVDLRRLVIARAERICEYCLIHEDDTFFGLEVDHVISEKHGGATNAANLALACLLCNRNKGSDIASLVPGAFRLTWLYHPRLHLWSDHFTLDLDQLVIRPRSEIGEATIRILRFNDEERLLERQALRRVGRYPSTAARKRIVSSA